MTEKALVPVAFLSMALGAFAGYTANPNISLAKFNSAPVVAQKGEPRSDAATTPIAGQGATDAGASWHKWQTVTDY